MYPPKSKEEKAIIKSPQNSILDTFFDGRIYTWEKVWKEIGLISDRIRDGKGNAPPSRPKIPDNLRKIKYRYVPAVKSPNYYINLLGDLYTSVSASLDTGLNVSVEKFSSALSGYTEAITLDVSKRLIAWETLLQRG